jgi:hypothetical protein
MAKKSILARDEKRRKMIDKYAEKRAELKAEIHHPHGAKTAVLRAAAHALTCASLA